MEEQEKKRYVIGIIGALLGAFIGSIPWILAYIFGNVIYAILSIVIVIGAFYGYKITKAKIDKKLPVILSIVSFIAISVTMLIIIPIILMHKSEISLTFEFFTTLYQTEEVATALIKDYVISLLFCFIVIGGIIVNLNKQIKHGVADKDIKIVTQSVENDKFSNLDIEKARDVFENNDALSKNHTITKELIVEELQKEFGSEKGKQIFDYLKVEGVIKKKANKYYFSEKAQISPYYRYGFTNLKVFLVILIIAVVLGVVIVFYEDNYNTNNNDVTNNTNEIYLNDIESGTVITSYNIENADITLEFDQDMMQFSKDQIAQLLGEEYADMYECVISDENFERMIIVLQNSKDEFEEGYTAKQYIEDAMALDETTEYEVKEKQIAGKTFYAVEIEYKLSEEDEESYIVNDYVYDAGDRFVCIIFENISTVEFNPEKIIK